MRSDNNREIKTIAPANGWVINQDGTMILTNNYLGSKNLASKTNQKFLNKR